MSGGPTAQASGGGARDTHHLAITLEPVLRAASAGRLSEIEWFHSQWQRGGAATGFARWTRPDGKTIDVMVKLPVGPVEYRWTTLLGSIEHEDWTNDDARPSPRVVACGTEVGGYDLAWLIVEKLTGPPLASHLDESGLHDLLRAAAEFQQRATACAPIDRAPPTPDWSKLIDRSREIARAGGIPESQKWNETLKKVHKCLPLLSEKWSRRSINCWCHGDLHPGNALRRATDNGHAPCVLVDLALVHPGHWVEDALYLERQFWGHADLLRGIKPVSELARLRRERGLPANDDYASVANLRRVLTASGAPALLDREGNPKYLHAALEMIEKTLPQVSH